jgi:NADH dehydrogenase FAD-containing subunit
MVWFPLLLVLLCCQGDYYEATCRYIYPEEKELVCCSPGDEGNPGAYFTVPYDILVVGVGCISNTFGIQVSRN